MDRGAWQAMVHRDTESYTTEAATQHAHSTYTHGGDSKPNRETGEEGLGGTVAALHFGLVDSG